MIDWEKRLRMVRIAAGAVLLIVLAVQAVRLPRIAENTAGQAAPTLKKLGATLENIQAATAATKSLVEMVSKDYYDPGNPTEGLFWSIQSMIESSTASSRTTEEMLADVRAALMGGKDTRGTIHEGVFLVATGLLGDLRKTVQDADADLNRLTGSADAALQPLAGTMRNIERLSADLEQKMRDGGDVDEAFDALAQAIRDFDKLIANKDIQKILASSAATSEHLAGSAESVDIALRPWRKRANQLKAIVSRIAGMLHLDPSRWF